jgi:hypothetical protein
VLKDVSPPTVGRDTYIAPGKMSGLYKNLKDHLATSTNKTFTFPVVSNDDLLNASNDNKGRDVNVEGFVCADIQKVVESGGGGGKAENPCTTDGGLVLYEDEGKKKEIKSNCLILKIKPEPCKTGGATGGSGGVWTGAYVPPRLVQ